METLKHILLILINKEAFNRNSFRPISVQNYIKIRGTITNILIQLEKIQVVYIL